MRCSRGHVELDEAYVGGWRSGGKRRRDAPGKTIVLGAKERGGRMIAGKIPDIKKATLRKAATQVVEPGSIVSTNELMSYGLLEPGGYQPGTVAHGKKQWARYDESHGALHHVNNVESFGRLFKKLVASTHIHVSAKYMDRYLREFTFRLNHRTQQNEMFDLLIGAV